MANTKEIQNRINSIQDTMKITKAMYMMSSMKLRKAKQKLADTEPFFYGTQQRIAEILAVFPEVQHIYFDNRSKDKEEKVKKKGYIVVTGDKGMAGAYNHNAIKQAQSMIDKNSADYKLFVVGEVGRAYFLSQGYEIDEKFRYSANNPSMHRARVIAEYIIDLYNQELLDEVYIVYTRMPNAITEEVLSERLLPFKTQGMLKKSYAEEKAESTGAAGTANDATKAGMSTTVGAAGATGTADTTAASHKLSNYELEAMEHGDGWYRFSPSPNAVLTSLVYNYITGFVYGALVECSASEENARMMAMQSATDNAEAMLHDLSIEYNRVRQAAITQEITEVIGGAKALKKKRKGEVI